MSQVVIQQLDQDALANAQAQSASQGKWDKVGSYMPSWVGSIVHSKKALLGLAILVTFCVIALAAPWISPGDPTDFVDRPHLAPSSNHWLGTSGQGQDVFAQTVWGARFTLQVGFLVAILTTLVGTAIGMTSGYLGGWVDDVLSLLTNVFLIIPTLPLLVVLAAFIGRGDMWFFVFVLTITGWAWPARVIRSQTLTLREKDFVSASVVVGESRRRIIFREILPNILSIIVASFFGSAIYAIGAQAALEFLGLGNPSKVTWGTNLYWASNNAGLLTGAWWTFVPAGVCIALVAFAFALTNYGIDEITNPRLRARRSVNDAVKTRDLKVSRGRATPVVRTES